MANVIDLTAMRNERDAKEWRNLQAGFLLDLFAYYNKRRASDMDELTRWVKSTIPPKAEGEIFYGWLLRRTVAEKGLASE